MPLITWNSSYSVKVKRFDSDHRQLFDIINQLHDGMKAGHGKDVMHKVLTQLVQYTERHFTAEEAVMKQLGYMQLPAHIEQHRKFTGKINEVASQYKAGAVGLSVEVLDFLTEWLSQHIVATDKQYSEFMNAKGVA